MSTVYVVTSGEYSDFRIEAIFETRQDADACVTRGAGEDVAEYELYGPGDDTFRLRKVFYTHVLITPDGVIGESKSDMQSWPSTQDKELFVSASVGPWVHQWRVDAVAATRDAAVKAVRERAAKVASLLAQGMNPAEMEEK